MYNLFHLYRNILKKYLKDKKYPKVRDYAEQ